MKRTFITVLFLFAALTGCTSRNNEEMPADLRTRVHQFYQAIDSGDLQKRWEMYGENALILPDHRPPVVGRENMRLRLLSRDPKVFKIRNREVLDTRVSSNLACIVSQFEYALTKQGETEQWHRTKNVQVWEKQTGKVWELQTDIWNSNVPMTQFNLE